jgi:hypothetical protein
MFVLTISNNLFLLGNRFVGYPCTDIGESGLIGRLRRKVPISIFRFVCGPVTTSGCVSWSYPLSTASTNSAMQ